MKNTKKNISVSSNRISITSTNKSSYKNQGRKFKTLLLPSSSQTNKEGGNHNRTKKNKELRRNFLFKRKKKQKRFKNPLFLSLK
jgi:hypothetical protein